MTERRERRGRESERESELDDGAEIGAERTDEEGDTTVDLLSSDSISITKRSSDDTNSVSRVGGRGLHCRIESKSWIYERTTLKREVVLLSCVDLWVSNCVNCALPNAAGNSLRMIVVCERSAKRVITVDNKITLI